MTIIYMQLTIWNIRFIDVFQIEISQIFYTQFNYQTGLNMCYYHKIYFIRVAP